MASRLSPSGDYLPLLADWQERLLGSDEAGAYLARRIAGARNPGQARAIMAAFMGMAFSSLRMNLRGLKHIEDLHMQKTFLSCEKVIQDNLDDAAAGSVVLTEADNLQAQNMRPSHFMAVYENCPALAETDWVMFQMLGELARGHRQAALSTETYLYRLQRVEKASRPGDNYEERALSSRLVECRRRLAEHDGIANAGQCLETCRLLAENYDPAHGTPGIVRQVRNLLNQAFAGYEEARATGKDVTYPNPFGLQLTAELKAEDRSTRDILQDFFKPERLVEARRVRMKAFVIRSPELMENICRMVQVLYAVRSADAGHEGTVDACGRVAERIDALGARAARFEKIACEDAEIVETRMGVLDKSLKNRVDGSSSGVQKPFGIRIECRRMKL